jgi:mRNA interferase HigB
VKSGNTATVFNIVGNRYRLITAIHYNRQMIFLMMVLTHAEYSTDKWKEIL